MVLRVLHKCLTATLKEEVKSIAKELDHHSELYLFAINGYLSFIRQGIMVVSPYIRATSHMRQESPWPLHFKHSHWWKKRTRSKFTSYYTWGSNGVCECKMDGCKVFMDFYMASNGSCFTWIIFLNHLLEVGLTQNQKTTALWTFITIDLFHFIMREDPCE